MSSFDFGEGGDGIKIQVDDIGMQLKVSQYMIDFVLCVRFVMTASLRRQHLCFKEGEDGKKMYK